MTTDNGHGHDTGERNGLRLMLVLAAITQQLGDQERGMGDMPCPVCASGTLVFVVAGPNAVAAKCSTQDCVAFMS